MDLSEEPLKNFKKISENEYTFRDGQENVKYSMKFKISVGELCISLTTELTFIIFEKNFSLDELHKFLFLQNFTTIEEVYNEIKFEIDNCKFKFIKSLNEAELCFTFSSNCKKFPIELKLPKLQQDTPRLVDLLIDKFLDMHIQIQFLKDKVDEKENEIVKIDKFHTLDEQMRFLNDKLDEKENEIMLLKSELLKLEKEKMCINPLYYKESEIILEDDMPFLENCLGKDLSNMTLLFDSMEDGDSVSEFHSKCDNKGPTLTLIKTVNNRRFGGYTCMSWDESDTWKADSNAFLFSLDKRKKILHDANQSSSIYCSGSYGPYFNSDLMICNNFSRTLENYSRLKYTYGKNDNTIKKYFLAGSQVFIVSYLEVYKID
jgi:hypothetical protein